ncbi:MAG: tRNA pseudouridine(55) synthase TruB [Verrucomicrobia bacterium GWF2_51_19]|nr:MAG: tRNA pseudouridine(55) synthase TruB [Verrucomicrobia bacterium GWF2_51_19]HCJ12287.1 tRNA pseudouridine(55) synthase TruB [Opitutae bacterium]
MNGIFLIDKPRGITSHDVVYRVRRKLGIKQVGHAGTLDPMATGLLIVLVGKGTKLSESLMGLDKVYEGTAKLGEVTDSYDADGEIVAIQDVPSLTSDDLKQFMQPFLGDQYQEPPMFSAKKIHGTPLYKLARKGQTVERPKRFIRIMEFSLLDFHLTSFDFRLHCTKGTYVRSVVHDIGQKIGCGAHLTALRRTRSGHLSIQDAIQLDVFESMDKLAIESCLIPPYRALPPRIA